VQTWKRHAIPAAHVGACHSSGARDTATGGAPIWVCRLWYVKPSRSATLCVAVEEHVVRRQVGAGDRAAPPAARCAGRSDSPTAVLDGSY
jgi:hypothetical protein